MKSVGKKIISMVLSLVIVFGLLSFGPGSIKSSAICCRKDYFDMSGYTLTGDMAHDVAMIAKLQKGRSCNDFGYSGVDYGAWCDEFVADCIENAGGDSSIVAHGSTVADFESKMRERGAVPVTSPKEGDLIFFTISHVEIVTKVENGVVYSAGGNNGSYPGLCKGERSTSWGTARLYLRPNYPTSHNSHSYNTYSHFDVNHPHYSYYKCSCGETKIDYSKTNYCESCIQCNPSAFCANYGDDFYGVILNTACWKPISKEGSNNITLETESGISTQKWRFQRQSDGAYVITSCYDGTALEMTDGIRVNDTQLSAHDGYWGGNYQQWYLIPQGSGVIFLSKHYTDEQWVMDLLENNTSDGNAITIQPRNNTNAQIWSIYNKSEVQLQPASLSAKVENSNVKFTWPNAYGATSYSLKIWTGGEGWNGQGELYLNVENVKSGYSVDLPVGTYYAYVDSRDYYSFIMSNVVTFTLSDKIPEKPVITDVVNNNNGTVTVKWTACERANAYTLRFFIPGETERIETIMWATKDTQYTHELPNGTYTVRVTAEGDGCWRDSEMSSEFTIAAETPEKPVITNVTSNDSGMVTVRWTECEKARSYSLRFYKSGKPYKSLIGVTRDTVYWYELPDGTYTVRVTAEGDGYWRDSEMSSEFTVSKKISDKPAFSAICTQCGEVFTDSDLYNSHISGHATEKPEYIYKMNVRNPSTTTINYGDRIILHVDLSDALPNGWYIEWTASNGNFAYSVSSDGLTCTISPLASGDTIFTATVYDSDGNVVSTDEQVMTSKAGFFYRIIAFFKKLFGLTKTIPQVFKGII